MKSIRSISAVSLALLVLVSSTSFLVGFHFCMGKVQNVALFTKADGCEKEKSLPPCHRHQIAPCCADETFFHEGDDLKASIGHYQDMAPAPVDLDRPMIMIAEVIPTSPVSRTQHYNYDPPWRPCDLTVKHQVFLI